MEERLKSHYESLARAIRFTRTADTKAAPVLGLQVALLGTMAARFDRLLLIIEEPWSAGTIILIVLIILYGFNLTIVIALAAWVYIPMNPRTGKSLIYFEHIASLEYEDFRSQATDMSEKVIEEHLIDQIYRVSKIASLKMRRVRWAFLLSIPTLVLWTILLGWGTVG